MNKILNYFESDRCLKDVLNGYIIIGVIIIVSSIIFFISEITNVW